jgi:hypothetical protein
MNGEQSPDCLRRSLQERKLHSFVTPVVCLTRVTVPFEGILASLVHPNEYFVL